MNAKFAFNDEHYLMLFLRITILEFKNHTQNIKDDIKKRGYISCTMYYCKQVSSQMQTK